MSRNKVPSAQVTKKVTTSSIAASGAPIAHVTALDSTGVVLDEKVLVINNNGFSD